MLSATSSALIGGLLSNQSASLECFNCKTATQIYKSVFYCTFMKCKCEKMIFTLCVCACVCGISDVSLVSLLTRNSEPIHFLLSSRWFSLSVLSTSSLLLLSLSPASVSVFPPLPSITAFLFSSFLPPPTPTWILLSAHTCGFCQFIIVKSDLTGSQRAGPQPHSNIFQPAALGRALERPLSSCLLFGGWGGRGCCEQCERVHVVPVRLLRGLLKDASVMRNKWFWKGGRRRRQPGWSAVSHPSHRRSLSDAQGRDCRRWGGIMSKQAPDGSQGRDSEGRSLSLICSWGPLLEDEARIMLSIEFQSCVFAVHCYFDGLFLVFF